MNACTPSTGTRGELRPRQRRVQRSPLAAVLLMATLLGSSLLGTAGASADPRGEAAMQPLRQRWEHINYEVPKDRRAEQFAALAADADRLAAANAGSAEVAIWQGIIYSTWAGADGGLSALGYAKKAKAAFERALRLDPQALGGSAYTSLGALYYQVPGWPIGFGDEDKARELLQKALALNPGGIDQNYFWADFLHDQGDDAGARVALQRALQAPPRPGRELADRGRRAEAQALLAKLH